MQTIESKKIANCSFIGIALSKDWFNGFVKAKNTIPFFRQEDNFVVGTWSDFHDGENSHIEGIQTLAVCRTKELAKLIFDEYTEITTLKNTPKRQPKH